MGPQSARSYPGRRTVKPAPPQAQRAKQEIDYGRRGKGYVFGAPELVEGPAGHRGGLHRNLRGPHHCELGRFPRRGRALDRRWGRTGLRGVDNLNLHSATDVLLFALAHPRWEFVFQPKYAAYLNLIEPWWKILRSLALKGRRFEAWPEIEEAVRRATAYWNAHKHPFLWGRKRRHRSARRLGVALVPNISAT
jgi:transposase